MSHFCLVHAACADVLSSWSSSELFWFGLCSFLPDTIESSNVAMITSSRLAPGLCPGPSCFLPACVLCTQSLSLQISARRTTAAARSIPSAPGSALRRLARVWRAPCALTALRAPATQVLSIELVSGCLVVFTRGMCAAECARCRDGHYCRGGVAMPCENGTPFRNRTVRMASRVAPVSRVQSAGLIVCVCRAARAIAAIAASHAETMTSAMMIREPFGVCLHVI